MRGASQSSQTDGASGVGTSSNVGGVRGWPPLSLVVRLAANATGSIRRWRLVLSAKIVVAALCLAGCSPQDASPPMGRTVPDAAGAAASGDLAAPANRDPLTGSISKPGVFQDIAAESGIEWQYRNGEAADEYSILESLGGGIGLIDFDQDGLLDVFLIGGGYFEKAQVKGHPNRMYRNEGGWKFRDVTGQLGLDEPRFYGHGCAVADFDSDGWPDLLVTGYGRLALYHNRQGRQFVERAAEAGLLSPKSDQHWSTGAAWSDLDLDGDLDLFVTHYLDWSFQNHPSCRGYGPDHPRDVCPPNIFSPLSQQMFFNNGDGTFRDVSQAAGLQPAKGLGVLMFDADENGLPDVYVTSDTLPNQLYLNRGDGRFEEAGRLRGVAVGELGSPEGSMGADVADLDGSGRLSLLVTNFERQLHALYLNQGDGLFGHGSSQAGIAALGTNRVGWGTAFLDFDLDGDEDLVISNGHVIRYPTPPQSVAQLAELLRNDPRELPSGTTVRFQNVSPAGGPYFRQPHQGRGVAVGDLDNDGRPDLVISHVNQPVAVLRNQLRTGHHWLGIELCGRDHKEPLGALLTLEVGGHGRTRVVKSGGSYLSSSDRRVVFGMAEQPQCDRLTVRWPGGERQVWEGSALGIDRYVRLVEGQAEPEVVVP
jgi:hypothetical protein